ncbi:MAG: CsgG/HfaB family protein [Spirochaetota bacterium]
MGRIVYLFMMLIVSSLFGAAQSGGADKKLKANVAVIDFVGKEGISRQEASSLSDVFRSWLVTTDFFTVVDRANMDKILKEQEFQQTGCTESSCAVELGRILNMQYMFTGTIARLGETFIITVNMLNVETTKILASRTRKVRGSKDALLDEMDRAGNDVLDAVKKETGVDFRASVEQQIVTMYIYSGDTKPNEAKPVLLLSSIGAAVLGGGLNVTGVLLQSSATTARNEYLAITGYQPQSMFDAKFTVYRDNMNIGSILNISGFSMYGIAAGLFALWLIAPDAVLDPTKVKKSDTTDTKKAPDGKGKGSLRGYILPAPDGMSFAFSYAF